MYTYSWICLIAVGFVLAGMDDLLSFVDLVASQNSDKLPELVRSAPPCEEVKQGLLAQAKAFDQGLFSCQRLLDVAVAPFFKLGRKAVQLQGTESQGCLDAFASRWGTAVVRIFSGDQATDSEGILRVFPVLRPLKRAELVKALSKTQLIEVRFRVSVICKQYMKDLALQTRPIHTLKDDHTFY